MKQILLLLTLVYFCNVYGQSQKDSLRKISNERIDKINKDQRDNPYYSKQEVIDEYINENNEFLSLSKPDVNNDLSNFLKNNLDSDLVKKINFSNIKSSYTYRNLPNKTYNHSIRLTFEINKNNKAYNFRLDTGNKDLDKHVKDVFKNYPIDKFSLNDTDKIGKISVQLFTKENNKTIIKASTFPVIDIVPTLEICEENNGKRSIYTCFYDKLFEYILANISATTISKQKLRGNININPRFSVDTTGKIFRVNSIAPNKIIKDEIDRIIESYNQIILPAKRNNKIKNAYCSTYRMLIIEDKK